MARREGISDLGTRAARVADVRQVIDRSIASDVLAAPTAFKAMVALSRTIRFQSTHLKVWLERRGSTLRLCHAHAVGPSYPGHEIVDAYMTWKLVDVMRRYFGPDWHPRRLFTSAMAAPGDVDMKTPPTCAGLEIPADRIWAPLILPASTGEPSGADHAPESTTEVLQACLCAYLLDGRPSLGLAAEVSGLSVRSLQRRLHDEGTSYSRVLDQARFEVACRQITDTDLPLTEIAFKVGYSEQSAFSRAFREWAGTTPSTFRKQHVAAAGTGNAPAQPFVH